jgi:hypothetical protein
LQGVLDTTFAIKFVSDLQQVGGFPRVLYFFPPIKHTITKINDNINMDCTIAWSMKVLILKLYDKLSLNRDGHMTSYYLIEIIIKV